MLSDRSNKRIGLALSGGAARGLAHLGVLTTLSRHNIPVDYVAGCSAGAILGAVYCAGMPADQMYKFAPYISWRRIAEPIRSAEGVLTFEKLERWLIMLLGDLEFSDLTIPLAIVAMDVDNGERVIIRHGRLAKAVRASCSIPGLVEPVEINARRLVDGGIVDNLPADAVRQMGADYVIGVDVFQPHYGRMGGPLGRGLTAIETLVRNSGGGVGRADFLIAPRTAGYSFVRFSNHQEMIRLGETAAEECLPFLIKDLDR
jgi:NTE family protein